MLVKQRRDCKPVAMNHRRIPFHFRSKVKKEINRLLKADVIEKIEEPTGWVSPVVIGNKPNGHIRLCVDMTEPNKSIKRIHHVIPASRAVMSTFLSELFKL